MTTPAPLADDTVVEARRPLAHGTPAANAEGPERDPDQAIETDVDPTYHHITDPALPATLPIPGSADPSDSHDLPDESIRAEPNELEVNDPGAFEGADQDEAYDADEDDGGAEHDGPAVELDRKALRAWRRARGLSQEQLAAAIRRAGDELGVPNKCTKRLIQKWESGDHRTIRPDYLRTLVHVTRLKTSNLIVIGADPRPPARKALQCATAIDDLTRMGAHCTAASTAVQVEWAGLLIALGDVHRQWAQQAAATAVSNAEPAPDGRDA